MRVLVVDDDCVTGELLANALGEFGYTVTVANDGCQALELARTGLYRLVVSDWEMPGMSGVEFCRQIRKRSWSGYIYVILLTSFSGVENVVRGLDAGADDFLTKPFQPQELRVRLRAGERVLALESREVTIFALAKLAERAIRKPERTWSVSASTAASLATSCPAGTRIVTRLTANTCNCFI